MNDTKYEIWLNNRAIRRSLHQFSEKLPDNLREEYLVLLEDVVSKQKSMQPSTSDFKLVAFRRYHALRSSWMMFMQR